MDESWDYFQEHSGRCLSGRSCREVSKDCCRGRELGWSIRCWKASGCKRLVERLAEKGAGWLGDVLNWLSNKIFKVKDKQAV